MTNPYDRHKRRWLAKGETESEEYLNQSIENFNSLVDNMEAPTVHRVKYTLPLDFVQGVADVGDKVGLDADGKLVKDATVVLGVVMKIYNWCGQESCLVRFL